MGQWFYGTGTNDSDGDGVPNAIDNCPDHPNADQIDADNDGWGDAYDGCPNDPNKTEPGICGCGVADTDTDSDGVMECQGDCNDHDPAMFPGNPEVCDDSKDNDCDGVIDFSDVDCLNSDPPGGINSILYILNNPSFPLEKLVFVTY